MPRISSGVPGGDDLAIDQHRNAVGQTEHHAHVVLDDQQRAALGQAADQRDRALGFGVAHAGGRLVQQDDTGAAGDGDADLQRPLLGIGQKPRGDVAPGGEVDVVENLRGAVAHLRQAVDVLPERIAMAGRPQHARSAGFPTRVMLAKTLVTWKLRDSPRRLIW